MIPRPRRTERLCGAASWPPGRLIRAGVRKSLLLGLCVIGLCVESGAFVSNSLLWGANSPRNEWFGERAVRRRDASAIRRRSTSEGMDKESAVQAAVADPPRSRAVQAWGTLGVIAYLSYGVAKVVPIVMEGIGSIEEPWQWGLLAVTLLFFAYVEGYKGFQNGFSPRVVSRAWAVSEEGEAMPLWHKILAPAFCIGYFHGTFRRVAASWGVTTIIFAVVIGVKQLENPYRAIVDAGVIVGLIWGIVSIIVIFLQSLADEKPPEFDPALPEDTPYTPPQQSA